MQVTNKQIINQGQDVVVVYTFDTKEEVSIWNNGCFFAYDKNNNYVYDEKANQLYSAITNYELH